MNPEAPHVQVDLRELGDDPVVGLVDRIQSLPAGTPCEVLDRRSLDRCRDEVCRRLPDRIEWWTLEDGPYVFRALVAQRRVADGPATLVNLFKSDHGRMRRIYAEARRSLETGDRQLAAQALAELRVGLTRHAAGEEAVLFPAFEATGIPGAKRMVGDLLEDHRKIREALVWVIASLGGEERFDQPEAVRRLDALAALVQAHEEREERFVLPKVGV